MPIQDKDMRVWPLRPNWDSPVEEGLIWATFVLASDTEVEQRISNKGGAFFSEYEVTFLESRETFQRMRAEFLNMGEDPFLLPLWHEAIRSQDESHLAYLSGFKEHKYGYRVNLNDPTDWVAGVLEESISPNVTQVVPPIYGYGKAQTTHILTGVAGSVFMPAAKVTVTDPISVSQITDNVVKFSVRFRKTDPTLMPSDLPSMPEYLGVPMLLRHPNWVEDGKRDYEFKQNVLQGQFGGPIYVSSLTNRPRISRTYRWDCFGKGQLAEAKELLWHLRGRWKSLWVPSFTNDIAVSRNYVSGGQYLYVKFGGWSRADGQGASEGMKHILFTRHDGSFVVAQVARYDRVSKTEERLTLEVPMGEDLITTDIERASFMTLSRLDQDRINLSHETDTGGVTSMGLTWVDVGGTRHGDVTPPPLPDYRNPPIPSWEDLLAMPVLGTTQSLLGYPNLAVPNLLSATRQDWIDYDQRIATATGQQTVLAYQTQYESGPAPQPRLTQYNTKGMVNFAGQSDGVLRRMMFMHLASAYLTPAEAADVTPNPVEYGDRRLDRAHINEPADWKTRAIESDHLGNAFYRSTLLRRAGPGPLSVTRIIANRASQDTSKTNIPGAYDSETELVARFTIGTTQVESGMPGIVADRKDRAVGVIVGGGELSDSGTSWDYQPAPWALNSINFNVAEEFFPESIRNASLSLARDSRNLLVSAGPRGVAQAVSHGYPLSLVEAVLVRSSDASASASANEVGDNMIRSDGFAGARSGDITVRVLSLDYFTVQVPAVTSTKVYVDIIDAVTGAMVTSLTSDRVQQTGLPTNSSPAGFVHRSVAVVLAIGEKTLKAFGPNTLGGPSLLVPGKQYLVRVRRSTS